MPRHRIPVLMYHALEAEPSAISLAPATFAWQMRWLKEEGFRVLPLAEVVARVTRREALPARAVALTFDDGFESVYTSAWPILARYDFPATVFLVSDYCGRRNDWPSQPAAIPRWPLMSWGQAREMASAGVELGSHTRSHPPLDTLPPAQAEDEVLAARAAIEEQLGQHVSHFAYPYGRSIPAVEALVRRAYAGACGTRLALAGRGSNPFALERVDALYLTHPRLFSLLGTPGLPVYLGLRRPLRAVAARLLRRRWA